MKEARRDVLVALLELGPSTRRELSAYLGRSPKSVGDVIRRARDSGLVGHSGHTRARRWHLTDEGLRRTHRLKEAKTVPGDLDTTVVICVNKEQLTRLLQEPNVHGDALAPEAAEAIAIALRKVTFKVGNGGERQVSYSFGLSER